MSDLTDFLMARIDEDEAVARTATKGPWDDRLGRLWGQTGVPDREILIATQTQVWNGDHITRHDPVRVLAECDAKRRIVTDIGVVVAEPFGVQWPTGYVEALEHTLRLLALPYRNHADYRAEWRPGRHGA